MPKVVVSIVSWNHAKYLPAALESLHNQTYQDISLIVVDNGSTDGTEAVVRENYPEATILRNVRNLGFARAYNQAIEYTRVNLANGEDIFVFVMNPDLILRPNFLERLLSRVAHRTDVGSASGKLLRVHEVAESDLQEKELTDIIDSTGLQLYKSRLAVDRNAGQKDSGRFERTDEIFGVTGAAALYRLRALIDVAVDSQYFDEDFFAYKEDVDLAWRLRLRGWSSLYVPEAVAYHHRTVKCQDKFSWWALLCGRRGRSKILSVLSYRNHWLTLIKNDYLENVFIALPFISFEETKKFFYFLFFEPTVLLKSSWATWRALPATLRKRHKIMSQAKSSAKEIRRWLI